MKKSTKITFISIVLVATGITFTFRSGADSIYIIPSAISFCTGMLIGALGIIFLKKDE